MQKIQFKPKIQSFFLFVLFELLSLNFISKLRNIESFRFKLYELNQNILIKQLIKKNKK